MAVWLAVAIRNDISLYRRKQRHVVATNKPYLPFTIVAL